MLAWAYVQKTLYYQALDIAELVSIRSTTGSPLDSRAYLAQILENDDAVVVAYKLISLPAAHSYEIHQQYLYIWVTTGSKVQFYSVDLIDWVKKPEITALYQDALDLLEVSDLKVYQSGVKIMNLLLAMLERLIEINSSGRGLEILPIFSAPRGPTQIHQLLHEFYKLLVEPIEYLDATKKIAVVPYGPISKVPFASLIPSLSGSADDILYLVEKYTIFQYPTLATAAKLIFSGKQRTETRKEASLRAVVVGNPVMPYVPKVCTSVNFFLIFH